MYESIDKWIIELLGEGLLATILSDLIKIIIAGLIAAAFYAVTKIIVSLIKSRTKFDAVRKGAESLHSRLSEASSYS